MFKFDRYLPLLDPDEFSDASFFRELDEMGYRQVLLGGTGAGDLAKLAEEIKRETRLTVVLYPAGPDSVTSKVDVVVLPDVMNSNSHHARPFGTAAVATAMNVARRKIDYVPVAYFIMGNSTARWYFDAFLVPQPKLIYAYVTCAQMLGYKYVALDYEDPNVDIDPKLIAMLKTIPGIDLIISDEFDPERANQSLQLGASTVITPSNLYEAASDPVALAARFYDKLLRA
jgi:heptaprenylglyceryl phosphate synthase